MRAIPLPRTANNFDFLRLFAALMVVIGHSFWLSGNGALEPVKVFTGFWDIADIAVHVFFVMSGFLIAGSWANTRSLLSFAGKRALRIFPALIVAVLFTTFVIGLLATKLPAGDYLSHASTWNYLTNISLHTEFRLPGVFAENAFPNTVNGSLWTLPFEVLMYLSLMGLGLIPLRGATIRVPVLLAALSFFAVHVVTVETTEFARMASLARLGTFFYAGAALYFFYDRLRWHWLIAVVLIVFQLALAQSQAWPVVHALTLPYLVIYVAHLRIPAIANVGKAGDFSYGLYIFSFPLQQLMVQWGGQSLSLGEFMAASLITSGVFAALSWYLVEEPAMRLKRYLPKSRAVGCPDSLRTT